MGSQNKDTILETRRGTTRMKYSIEVDILTGEPMQVTMDQTDIGRVTAEKLSKKMSAVKKMSRVEKEEELIQKAMRKKSRKVSRQGDYVVFTDRKGVLTTQNGTQQIVERRVKLGSHDLEKLVELGY